MDNKSLIYSLNAAVVCIFIMMLSCSLYGTGVSDYSDKKTHLKLNNSTGNKVSLEAFTSDSYTGDNKNSEKTNPIVSDPFAQSVLSSMKNSKSNVQNQSSQDTTSNTSDVVNTQATEKLFYIISNFEYPDEHELHIKIWKDGKETEEYYVFEKGVGIMVADEVIKYPHVDVLCCIKYGKKGDLKPFSIDLNLKGEGLTDLPGCNIEESKTPEDSLNVKLPNIIPSFNM